MSESQANLASVPASSVVLASETAAPRDDEFVGVLLPSQMANLAPRVDAKIVVVRRKVGETVVKDDVIVGFDLRDQQHDLAARKRA